MAVRTDQYVIEPVFNSRGAEKAVSRYGTVTGRATEKIREMVSQKGYLYYSMKRIASYTAIFSFFGSLAKLIGETVELELRLAEVNTLIDKTNQDAVRSYHQVSQALLRLDPHLGTAVDLTKGLYEIISAGVTDPQQAFELLVTSAKYAKVGLTDLATAASSLTAVMKAYGYTAEMMREKSDVLFASVREGKFHTDELNAAIGKVLPTAATMGVSIEEVTAALAVMTQRGLDVNEAATSLNRMLISFLRPIDKAKARFQELGWQWGINAFEGKGLLGALQDLETASSRYSDLLPIIFRRQRALKGGFILQGEGLKALEGMYGRVRAASAGAGIVQEEYSRITGTVAEEAKALHANLQQGFSGLLKYKGAVAETVRTLSSFLRMVIEHVPQLMVFAGALLTVRKAMIILNSTTMQAIILKIQEARLLIQGKGFVMGYAAAQQAAATATKTANMALAATNVILLAATVAYLGITWLIRKKKEAEEAAAKASEQHKKMQSQLNDELETMAAAWEKATGAVRDFNKEVDLAVLNRMWDETLRRVRDVALETGKGFGSAIAMVRKETGTMGAEFKEAWATVKRVLQGKPVDPSKLIEARELMRTLGMEWGLYNEEIQKADENLRNTSDTYVRAMDAMGQKTLMFGKSLKLINQELTTSQQELALKYSADELKNMVKAIEQLRGGVTELEKKQLKATFGLDVDMMLEKGDELNAMLQKLGWAIEHEYGEKAKERIEDYTRTYIASWDSISLSQAQATERAQALFDAYHTRQIKDEADTVAWADKHKGLIEMIMRWSAALPEEQRKHFEWLETMREKDKKGVKDWSGAYKTAYDRFADDYTVMMTKIQEMKNEYMGKEYEDILSQIERQKIAWVNHAEKMFELAQKSGQDMVTARAQYQEQMRMIDEVVAEAQKLSMFRQLKTFLTNQKKELDALKVGAAERLRLTEEKRKTAHDFIMKMGIQDEAFMAWLLKQVDEYWDNIAEEAEKSKNLLLELAQAFGSIGRSLQETSNDLTDFLNLIGLSNSFLGRLVGALGIAGEGMQRLGTHIRAIKEAREVGGIVGAIGQIGGAIGGVVTIATTAIGIFKKLFGGKTEEEKAQERAEKEQKRMEEWVAWFQKSFSFLGDISEATAKKIYELTKEGMPQFIAVAKELGSIMDDTGISMDNFAYYATRAGDVLHQVDGQFLKTEEASKVVGEAFGKLVDYAKEAGIEGHRALLALIRKSKELGYEIKEIQDYINENLSRAASGLTAMMQGFSNEWTEAADKLAELKDKKKGLLLELDKYRQKMADAATGSEAWKTARDRVAELVEEIAGLNLEIVDYQGIIENVTDATKRQVEDMGIVVAGVFSAMVAEGMPMVDILDQMSESVFALMNRYAALGLEVPEYLQPVFDAFEIFKEKPKFFEGLQGLQDVLSGLGNSGWLTVDAFEALNREAKRYFNQLTRTKAEGGFGLAEEKAIRMMYPLLQQMWWYAEQYGMKLPKWAQEAVEAAKGLGLKFEKPATDRLVDEMQRMNDRIIPHQTKSIRSKLHEIIETLHLVKGYQFGTPRTTGGLAMLHPNEAILPENLTESLRRFFTGQRGAIGDGSDGGLVEAHIYIDGERTYRALVPYIKKGGRYSDWETAGDGVF